MSKKRVNHRVGGGSPIQQKLTIDTLPQFEQAFEIQKALTVEEALKSTDVGTLMKAQNYLKSIQKREEVDFKSILVDPLDFSVSLGYRHKPFSISYDVLRAMSRLHIVKAIVNTRKDQVSDFSTPRGNKNGVGFIVRKKKGYYESALDTKKQPTKQDNERIEQITEFLMQCGSLENTWHADDFDDFIRKITEDSLVLDQATFEIPRNKMGFPVEFFATDAATYRVADSYEDEQAKKEVVIKGYTPSYVQLYNGNIISEFYPWELCFGRRNPSTDIYSNGYGRSELEDMVQTITAILNADSYNANFFKVGSAPKGILKYSGNINPNTVEDFRRQWTAQVAGVMNMHKIPMINADKMDFVSLGQSNKDMEFSKFQEFLIKITCAVYKIDPAEVGFPMQGTSEAAGLGGDGGTKEKLKYSRSKGLKPLLRKMEKWINKYIVSQLDPNFEFVYVGIDDEDDENAELERDIKSVSNFMTLNEIRKKRGLKPIEDGDVVLNPTFLQAKGMAQQQQGMGGEGEGEGEQNLFMSDGEEEENPFMKSLQTDLEKIFQ